MMMRTVRLVGILAIAGLAGSGTGCASDRPRDDDGKLGEQLAQLQRELDGAARANPARVQAVRSVRPVLDCVEQLGNDRWRGRFGYLNQSVSPIAIPIGFFNRFWPVPLNRGQPTTIEPGVQRDVVDVEFGRHDGVIWVLGSHWAVATRFSRACPHDGSGGSGVGGGAGVGGAGGGVGGSGGAGGYGGAGGSGGAGGYPGLPLCDDHNPCTVDFRDPAFPSQCIQLRVREGTPCDDLDPATGPDTCQLGVCSGCPLGSCGSHDQCQICTPVAGGCAIVEAAQGTICDSGGGPSSGACRAGACEPAVPCGTRSCFAADEFCYEFYGRGGSGGNGAPVFGGAGCSRLGACAGQGCGCQPPQLLGIPCSCSLAGGGGVTYNCGWDGFVPTIPY